MTLRVSVCSSGANASTQVRRVTQVPPPPVHNLLSHRVQIAAVVRSLQTLLTQASVSNASLTTLGAFLAAVASAAGVPPGAMFIAGFDAPVITLATRTAGGTSASPPAAAVPAGVIGGAVVGSVLGATLLAALVVAFMRWREVSHQREADPPWQPADDHNPAGPAAAFEVQNPMQRRRERLEVTGSA